jgi:hypothetical protein
LPWIRQNLTFSADTAERYIRLWRNRDKVIAAKPGTLAKAMEAIVGRGKIRPESARDPKRQLICDLNLARQRTIAPIRAASKAVTRLTLPEDDLTLVLDEYREALEEALRRIE